MSAARMHTTATSLRRQAGELEIRAQDDLTWASAYDRYPAHAEHAASLRARAALRKARAADLLRQASWHEEQAAQVG